jgi:hypothetical protein
LWARFCFRIFSGAEFRREGVQARMPVRLDRLLKLKSLERLQVVAGKNGLGREVVWVNIIESPDLVRFIHRSELVISTGVEIKGSAEALLRLIRGASEAGAAGCVVNLGPYIPSLPEEAVSFADGRGFPLITVPWDVRMADLTQAICDCLISSRGKDGETKDLLFRLLSGEGGREEVLRQLDLHGLHRVLCGVLAVDVKGEGASSLLHEIGSRLIYSYFRYETFPLGGRDIFVVMKQSIHGGSAKFTGMYGVLKELNGALEAADAKIGIGGFYETPSKLVLSCQQAVTAVKVPLPADSKYRFQEFRDLGMYRVLLYLSGNPELSGFFRETLQPLEDYDAINLTHYMDFLRIYLKNDANIAKTSRELFIHRNTALYRLGKIEKILGRSLSPLQTKTELMTAMILRDYF